MRDIRYAVRSLRRQPVFTVAALVTLALGIGANTAIFGVLYDTVLRPLPYAHPDRLVFVWNAYQKAGDLSDVAIPDYLDRRAAPGVEVAALFTVRDATVSNGRTPEQVVSLAVTPSFFTTLGRGPFLGRAFGPEDVNDGVTNPVILTYGFWRTRLGGDAGAIGQPIRLNASVHTVVGVLPADFELPARDVAVLVPFVFTPEQMTDAERGNEFSTMIARLRPGTTIQQFNAQMRAIVDRLQITVPSRAAYMRNSGFAGVAVDMRTQIAGQARTPLYLLQAGVVLVLLIACANVANLLLMRAAGRQRELAIRASLGAGGARLTRQLLIEGLALSVPGAAAGLGLAVAGSRTLMVVAGEALPRAASAGLPVPVLLFTLIVAAVAGLMFGLVPAVSILRAPPAAALRADDTRGSSAGRQALRLRGALAAGEIALAVVLLVTAGLLIRSLDRLLQVDPGFVADHVVTAQIALPAARYPDGPARRAFWDRLLDRTQHMPGVSSAGLISELPFSDTQSSGTYRIVGRQLGSGERLPHAGQSVVGGDYFETMRIPLLDGRLFDGRDGADAARVVIVDRMLADRQFPEGGAIGHQINFGSSRNYTIVGVVGTVHAADLSRDVPEERVYLNGRQVPESRMAVLVRTAAEPLEVVPQVRAAVVSIDPEQPIARVRTMDGWIARSLTPRRTPMALLSLFGAVALVLAAVGIYGVMAFGVAERTREFGIRQALGADRRDILGLVFKHGARTAGIGLTLGLLAALSATRLLGAMLFGVAPYDPVVLGVVCALLTTVAGVACYLPARRATRVAPLDALRTG